MAAENWHAVLDPAERERDRTSVEQTGAGPSSSGDGIRRIETLYRQRQGRTAPRSPVGSPWATAPSSMRTGLLGGEHQIVDDREARL